MPEQWLFSPLRLRGHRERVGLSRPELAQRVKIVKGSEIKELKADTIKAYEYGAIKPGLDAFLSLADSLDISPNDLCRTSDDDEMEYLAGKHWPLPPPSPQQTRTT